MADVCLICVMVTVAALLGKGESTAAVAPVIACMSVDWIGVVCEYWLVIAANVYVADRVFIYTEIARPASNVPSNNSSRIGMMTANSIAARPLVETMNRRQKNFDGRLMIRTAPPERH